MHSILLPHGQQVSTLLINMWWHLVEIMFKGVTHQRGWEIIGCVAVGITLTTMPATRMMVIRSIAEIIAIAAMLPKCRTCAPRPVNILAIYSTMGQYTVNVLPTYSQLYSRYTLCGGNIVSIYEMIAMLPKCRTCAPKSVNILAICCQYTLNLLAIYSPGGNNLSTYSSPRGQYTRTILSTGVIYSQYTLCGVNIVY